MAVFYNSSATSSTYLYIDYTFGTLCIFLSILSLFLNGIIFLFFYPAKTVLANLYKTLAISDLLTLSVHPLIMAFNFFNKDPGRSVPIELLIISSLVTYNVINLSGYITTLMCLYRLLAVKYPFMVVSELKNRMIIMGLIVMSVAIGVCQIYASDLNWNQKVQLLSPKMGKTSNATSSKIKTMRFVQTFNMVNGLFSILVSLVTMVLLLITLKKTQYRDSIIRTGNTIMILNLVYCVGLIYLLILPFLGKYRKEDWYGVVHFAGFPFIPMALSAVNPLIIVFRSSDLKGYITKRGFLRSRTNYSIAIPATGNHFIQGVQLQNQARVQLQNQVRGGSSNGSSNRSQDINLKRDTVTETMI